MNDDMPPDPCAVNVLDGHVIVEPEPSVHDAGHLPDRYSVKPAVELEPSTRCTTLIVPVAVMPGLSATISASFHVVICVDMIFASTQPVRWIDPDVGSSDDGTEWNSPIAPSAKGTCTIVRPAPTTELYRAFVIGMSPDPKWLSAMLPFDAPRNSFCPVDEPTARYVRCTGPFVRSSMMSIDCQKSRDGLVVPEPCSSFTAFDWRVVTAACRAATVA
mmetsp:Transcript_40727/g.118826  ORF Transcript_40727/g.118826 Transcript_40727/m.118826 type:complete len:217 (-) Transcript_40727:78-728(-)